MNLYGRFTLAACHTSHMDRSIIFKRFAFWSKSRVTAVGDTHEENGQKSEFTHSPLLALPLARHQSWEHLQ